MSNDDAPGDDSDDSFDPEAIVTVEITDELDLHTFHPRDVKALVTDYLEEAAARGFPEVRIIHGKGQGTLRTIVHAVCDKHPRVASYKVAERGGWGATSVTLRAT